MPIDWIYGLIGGLLIGAGGAVYLLGAGRVMGASGIVGGLIDGTTRSQAAERIAFLGALFAVPLGLNALAGGTAQTHVTSNLFVVLVAGLLVGLGTRIANGCTSGHGVCGISRLSLRGIVATLVYILAGGLTILVLRHVLGLI
ncbi:MAG: YeeE/YedE thiosulfate transporter family protein [Pseudomonadota bacterium]